MIVFFIMIDISALNASIIWLKWQNTIPEKYIGRRSLIIELAKTLAGILAQESANCKCSVNLSFTSGR